MKNCSLNEIAASEKFHILLSLKQEKKENHNKREYLRVNNVLD